MYAVCEARFLRALSTHQVDVQMKGVYEAYALRIVSLLMRVVVRLVGTSGILLYIFSGVMPGCGTHLCVSNLCEFCLLGRRDSKQVDCVDLICIAQFNLECSFCERECLKNYGIFTTWV